MSEVFLSYAREDRALVERLAARLEASGYRVWWDRHLAGGAAFAQEIERKIDGALAVVVVWTDAAAQSHWVQEEASAGRDAGKLVPLRIGAAQPPMGFRQLHTIDYAETAGKPDDAAIAALIADLERLKGAPATPARAPTQAPAVFLSAPAPKRPVRVLIIAAAALGLVSIAASLFAMRDRAPQTPDRDSVSVSVSARPEQADSGSLADALAASLARAPWMRVASETGEAKRPASYRIVVAVEGKGAGARVMATVVDARTEAIAWSFSAAAPGASPNDPAVAMQLADAIWRGLYEAEGARLKAAPPAALAPREYIAKALAGGVYAPWTEEGVREAIGVLGEGLKKHPLDAELLASAAQAEFMLSVIDPGAGAALASQAEEKLAQAVTLAPKSRWVTGVSADVYFSTGRYRAAADAYGRLIEQGHDLPATRARAIDAVARMSGGFEDAAARIATLAPAVFSPLQRSQVNGALAYMLAASGRDAEALDRARLAVAAYPNNPDAIRVLIISAMLGGDDATLDDAAQSLCRFYPSYRFPPPEQAGLLAASLSGDGGEGWRSFTRRVADAYAARAAIVLAACTA